MVAQTQQIYYDVHYTNYREAYKARDEHEHCISRIPSERYEQGVLHAERKEWLFGWHGEHNGYDASSQNNSKHEGCEHGIAVASETGFFVLLQILNGVEAFLESGNECVAIVKGGSGCEEEFLKCFIFLHTFNIVLRLSLPRESCFFTASMVQSVMSAISFTE